MKRTIGSLALVTLCVVCGCRLATEPTPELTRITRLQGDEVQPAVSPNAKDVVFVHRVGGRGDIVLQRLATGEVRILAASAADETDPRWSPDGRRILFTASDDAGSRLMQVDLDGAIQQLSPPGQTARRGRWSPDGSRIAYAQREAGREQVWMMRADGSDEQPVSVGPADHVPYGWSPDGRYILALAIGTAHDVVALAADGSEVLPVTSHEGEEWWPEWSPRGDRVLFYTTWGDEMTEVWTAGVADGILTRITDSPVEDFRATWSPTGRWIAYNSDEASDSGVWLRSADGRTAIPVALDGKAGGLAAWSPDGRGLVFSYAKSTDQLYRVVKGTAPRAMTDQPGGASQAAVDREGQRVAFVSAGQGTEADLYLLDTRTGEVRRLTDEVTANSHPSWSPDGTHLVFMRNLGGGSRTDQIATLSLATREVRLLTREGYASDPVWCGDRIAYTQLDPESGAADRIRVLAVAGGPPRDIEWPGVGLQTTDCTAEGLLAFTARDGSTAQVWYGLLDAEAGLTEPVLVGDGEGGRWSPDGERLAFLSERDGQPDLYVVRRGAAAAHRVTDSKLSESWPTWLGDDLLYAANPEGRDLWMADLGPLLSP